jgi:uncharacterized protein YjbI with pentapeptide repeats
MRSSLIQAFGGLFFLLALFITYRTFRLNTEGQITTRYTAAVEHLGHNSMDVRLGGIYALERIANDSDRDRETIFDVLAAFIRQHAPCSDSSLALPHTPPSEDVFAALSVIGNKRRRQTSRNRPLNLAQTDLRGSLLVNSHFELLVLASIHFEHSSFVGVGFDDAYASKAHFDHCSFIGASFQNAVLTAANFKDAHLESVMLNNANLREANLSHLKCKSVVFYQADLTLADLHGADLHMCSLEGACLKEANLENANLRGAILRDADFEGANLKNAILERANVEGASFANANLEGVAPLPS